MIPNFVQQIVSIESALKTASSDAANDWKDNNKERFYDAYINEYEEKLELFVRGGTEMYGMGLDELLRFLDEKEREIQALV